MPPGPGNRAITAMAWFLAFWSRRSTATVVRAATSASARTHANARRKAGYGRLLSVQRANAQDRRLIVQGTWVRRRRDGSSPQFGSRAQKARARRQRSRYRPSL
ncbi:MAG: hypothetical protein ACRC1L_03970 [Prochlorococcaceae cyanobacterium]